MSQELADTLRVWVEDFLADLQRRGYSPQSIKTYGCDLQMFAGWVEQQTDLKMPGDLTTGALERYQMHLMLRPSRVQRTAHPRSLTAGSRNRHLAELRSFFRFLKRACRLLSNPSADLERARQPKRLPKNILSVPEMARLLGGISGETPADLRDLAALELLYGTALRRGELLRLELSDLRLAEGLIHVLGKGNKERVLPMGKAALQALERYLCEGRPRLVQRASPALWLSVHHGGRVSEYELLTALQGHAQRAGIRKRLGFHLFRHTAATHLLRGGADVRALQVLLGHAQLNTTAIYTRVDVSDLQKTLKQCHPREKEEPPTS